MISRRHTKTESEARKLWIQGASGRLEAMLRVAPQPRAAAVLAHPHPLYGGSLHNPVIFHADRELNRAGLTTLRFNFRGVGQSEGAFDEGRGEVDDLAAAATWIRGLALGAPLLLVGYSFGAVCAVRLAPADRSIAGVVAIGLPVRRWAFDEIARMGKPIAVVQGSADEFGSPAEVAALLERAEPPGRLRVVDRAPHLFDGAAPVAAAEVRLAAEEMLSAG